MKNKIPIFLPALVLIAAVLACAPNISLPKIETIPTQTLTVNETLPETTEMADLTLRMGMGSLNLSGGGSGLVTGEIKYNVAEWEPAIRSSGTVVTIEQGNSGFNLGTLSSEVINVWDLKLGTTPLNLQVEAGAAESKMALGGVPLRRLSIAFGTGQAEVTFDTANPQTLESLKCQSGAGQVTLTGLANANFESLIFEGGAGNYTLDFSGELQKDAQVKISAGTGNLRLVIPAETAATVDVSEGTGQVETEGAWTRQDGVYSTGGSGPRLDITVEIGVGKLTLVLSQP